MIDLNIFNYFIIVLTGFSVVWSYRRYTGQNDKPIGEFEYAALSAIWGIPIGLLLLIFVHFFPSSADLFDKAPMFGTIVFLPVGFLMGAIGAWYKMRQTKPKDTHRKKK